LITAKSDAVFGGVYKLVALEREGKVIPKIKISENVEKITNPSFKKVCRFYSKDTRFALADVIMLKDEEVPDILKSGHHEKIENWRRKKAIEITYKKRPDLLENGNFTEDEIEYIKNLKEKNN